MTAARPLSFSEEGDPDGDDRLLERARRGDALAFAALATRHWGTVHRIARNMLAGAAAPAEVAEAVFLSMLRSGEDFPRGVHFQRSLYRVALGECWRRIPATRPSEAPLDEYLPRFEPGGRLAFAGEDWPGGERSAEQIRGGLQRLEALDRAAFLLREIERLSSEEAAAVLGIPPASIRARTHRATLILTGYLSRAGASPALRC